MVTRNSANMSTGASGTIAQGQGIGTAVAFSTATYPATAGTSGKILISDGTNIISSTPTYPNASGNNLKIMYSDGTNFVTSAAGFPVAIASAGKIIQTNGFSGWIESPFTLPTSTTINRILYSSAANTVGEITTANNGTLVTSSTGVPSILAGPVTTGNILQSNAAAAPSFSTATYPITTTSQQILYSTAANVVGQLTTANSALAATNSSGTLAMRLFSVVTQNFSVDGTYTPTAGMLYCIVRMVGGGGGGAGAEATTAAQVSNGGGGGAGEYAEGTFSAATIGASQAVTIGAAGAANSGASGGNGGTTSLGSLLTALGGIGGVTATAAAQISQPGSLGGSGGTGGSFHSGGAPGLYAGGSVTGATLIGGEGGSSFFGAGGVGAAPNAAGNAAVGNGAGGGCAQNFTSQSARSGGVGRKGRIVVDEYVIA